MLSTISDKTVMSFYRAKTPRDLSSALFNFVSELVPDIHLQILFLGGDTDHPQLFCSHSTILSTFQTYLDGKRNGEDIWLATGLTPPEHHLKWKAESFCKKISSKNVLHLELMRVAGAEHAVSFCVWKQGAWQGCLTLTKTLAQGPFSGKEMAKLQAFRPHFQSAVERVIGLNEDDVYLRALETFIWSLPSATIVLNWDLKVLYYNASALELAECWMENLAYAHNKKSKVVSLPRDLLTASEQAKKQLSTLKKNTKGGYKASLLTEHQHPKLTELAAKIYFYPSPGEALNEGTFLINLQRQSKNPDEKVTYDSFASLSPRERDVVLLAAQGKKSGEISERLGTASITVRMQLHSAYKKLGINTRYELVRMFSQGPENGQLTNGTAVPQPRPATELTNGKAPHEALDPFLLSLTLLALELPEGVALADVAGEILWTNPAFTRLSGYTLDELRGKKLGGCLIDKTSDTHAVHRFQHALESAKPCDCELIYQKKNHAPWPVSIRLRQLKGPESLVGQMVLHQEVKG